MSVYTFSRHLLSAGTDTGSSRKLHKISIKMKSHCTVLPKHSKIPSVTHKPVRTKPLDAGHGLIGAGA